MTVDERMNLAVAKARAREKIRNESFWDFAARVRILDQSQRAQVPFEMWPHLERRFHSWIEGNSEVILKARQEGFSWSLAVYAAFVAKQPYTQILMLSSGEYYAKELLNKVKYVLATTSTPVERENASEVHIRGGGIIRALPSTEDAGRSFTGSLVIVDEAAFHDYAEENAKAYIPTVADGGGQILMCSTSNGASGYFFDVWMAAEEREFVQVFEPWWVRPGRNEEWERKTRARMTSDAFKREYPSTPDEAFELQRGLVYGDSFDKDLHFRPGPPPAGWEDCLYTYAAYDLGGGDPTAVVIFGVYRDHAAQGLRVHFYDYYYRREGAPTVDELYSFIAPWKPYKTICDHVAGGDTIRNSLEAMGLSCERANPSRESGVDVVKLFLQKNWVTFEPSDDLLREFRTYRYATRFDSHTKTRYPTSTPFDHHGDLMDAIRYGLVAAYVDIWNAEGGSTAYAGAQW